MTRPDARLGLGRFLFQPEGNLFVSDAADSRVLKYATPFADYRQWEDARRRERPRVVAKPRPVPVRTAGKVPPKKLTWAEQREWAGMEASILAAEETLARCETAAHDPAIAARAEELAARCHELQQAHDAVDRLYTRWAELDAKRG